MFLGQEARVTATDGPRETRFIDTPGEGRP
jgi:hypothetical protein